jgi:hypothetical protein
MRSLIAPPRSCASRHTLAALVAILALSLAGCGGGSDGTGAPPVAVAPAPTPTRTPTPTPTAGAVAYTPSALPSSLNATVGLNQQTSFNVLSWFFRDKVASDDADGRTLVEVGYDPAKTSTTMLIPGSASSYLDALAASSGTDFTRSVLVPAGGIEVTLLRPGTQNTVLALNFTSVGRWEVSKLFALPADPTIGVLAYGIPTPSGGIPTSGAGRFALLGYAAYSALTEGYIVTPFRGDLDVDFAARTVAGRIQVGDRPGFDPASASVLTLTQTSLAADGTFSGTSRFADGSTGPSYQGRLAGPQGQEVILRWSALLRAAVGGNISAIHHGAMAGKR